MFCPNCGKPIKEKSNFCPFCGCDLSQFYLEQDKPIPKETPKETVHKEKNKSRHKGRFTGILIAVLAVIAVIMVLAFRQDSIRHLTQTMQEKNDTLDAGVSSSDDAVFIDDPELAEEIRKAAEGIGADADSSGTEEHTEKAAEDEGTLDESIVHSEESFEVGTDENAASEASKASEELDAADKSEDGEASVKAKGTPPGSPTEKNEEGKVVSEGKTNKDSAKADSMISVNAAYVPLIQNLQNSHGKVEIEEVDNGSPEGKIQLYSGLCFLDLIDFNGDGQDELLAAYRNRKEDYTYTLELYGIQDGKAALLWSGEPFVQGMPAVVRIYITVYQGKKYLYLPSGMMFWALTLDSSGNILTFDSNSELAKLDDFGPDETYLLNAYPDLFAQSGSNDADDVWSYSNFQKTEEMLNQVLTALGMS